MVKEFPFFRLPPAAAARGGCRCGQSGPGRDRQAAAIDNLKSQLAAQAPERLKLLKTLLGAAGLVIYVNGPGGVQKKVL